jgi:hypothetical protein
MAGRRSLLVCVALAATALQIRQLHNLRQWVEVVRPS